MLRILHIRRISTGSRNVPSVGTVISLFRTFRDEDLRQFVALTGDHNPIHATNRGMKSDTVNGSDEVFVNGAFLNAVIAGIIGTNFPGFVVTTQSFRFPNRCQLHQEVQFSVRVEELRKVVTVSYESKQSDRIVFEGTAKLFAVRK
uniref:MaoC-like domain-containing protein n=1 Tax=Anopheles atroparvus TaxID=41427 RepID=A0AAG5CXI9_ANOAO